MINHLAYDSNKRDENCKTAVKSKIFRLRKELDFVKKIIIDKSNVILCTNVGAGNKILLDYIHEYKNYFDVVIIDEAAQAIEYSCWIPILLGKKLIMVGDHKQLQPTIKSKEAKNELSHTLFEKMIELFPIKNNDL